jgi:LmbE family N-acetylglucosaminyl deacetylase
MFAALIAGVLVEFAEIQPIEASAQAQTVALDANTRLLVVAPHPDDEVIAAGGVIQRVREANGAVRIVYLTDGDAFTEGVRAESHVAVPRPADYRQYGRLRQQEARRSLQLLGIGRESLTFLGFPDEGLGRLLTSYWSDRRTAYRSRFTRRDRPMPIEEIQSLVKFSGEDLTRELATVIGEFKPTLILTPRKEDQHVDHCSAWYFTEDALGDVQRADPDFHTDLLTYIVHYYSWPFERESRQLPAPAGLSSGTSGWLSVPLSDRELTAKRRALRSYKSQMLMMDWFLEGFARRNEIFSRPAPRPIVLPLHSSQCN